MSRQAFKENKKIKLFFDYDFELVNEVRELAGRKYIPENKCWTCPICLSNLDKIAELNFVLDKELEKEYYRLKNIKNTKTDKIIYDVSNIKVPDGLSLMPFQLDGVAFIENRNGNAIIGDEMGLGKTITTLTYINNHPEIKPIIIIVPASLKYNWKNEIDKWLIIKRDIQILSGRKAYKLDKKLTDIVIINYDIVNYWVKELQKLKFDLIVLDEAHLIKNKKSNRSAAVKKLAKKIKHKLPLSGTPAINKPIELYEVINMVEPNLFSSYKEFGMIYCNGFFNGYGWDFSGSSNLDELYFILKNVMLRRKKADVLDDLPDKQYSYIPLEMKYVKEYREAEHYFLNSLKKDGSKKDKIDICNAEQLFQLAARGALPYSIDWIKQFLETGEEKLVVFATHKFIIDALMSEFKDIAVKIDGSVSTGQIRQDIVNRFQTDDKIKLFIGNIKAAGVGITLTAASNVAFLELPWTPAELNQAVDRVHRISQKNAVNVWFLLAKDTIEMKLAKILSDKQDILNQAIDGAEFKEQNAVSILLETYTN